MSESCPAVEPLLAEVASGQSDPLSRRVVDEHVGRCHDCARTLEELAASWRALDAWEVPPPPARAEAVVFDRVRADLGARFAPRTVALALVLGLGASFASACLVHLRAPLAGGTLALLFCGGIWTMAYALAFHVVLSRRPGAGARAALWASAALVLLSLACPIAQLTDVCHGSAGITAILGHGPATYFAVGALYGLVPAAVGFLATRRQRRGGILASAPIALAILAVELPLFYLQCRPFAAGAFVSVLVGAASGAVLAGLAHLPFTARTKRATS
jgi:hypothetical protein